MFLFLCCKDTIKSNTRQIFSIKSYIKAYYLTFLNIKIKDYYYFTYYLWYCYYYILYVSYYITYLIIYKEQKQTGKKKKRKRKTEGEREEQGKGCRRHPRQFLASLPFRLLSSPSEPSPALNTSPSHRESGRAGTLPFRSG